MATPTLVDDVTILGLPLAGKHLHAYYEPKKIDLGYVRVPKGVYSTFIKQNAKTTTSAIDAKHTTFLMYFFCKFFFGTTSVGIVQEFQTYVSKMMSGDVYSGGPSASSSSAARALGP